MSSLTPLDSNQSQQPTKNQNKGKRAPIQFNGHRNRQSITERLRKVNKDRELQEQEPIEKPPKKARTYIDLTHSKQNEEPEEEEGEPLLISEKTEIPQSDSSSIQGFNINSAHPHILLPSPSQSTPVLHPVQQNLAVTTNNLPVIRFADYFDVNLVDFTVTIKQNQYKQKFSEKEVSFFYELVNGTKNLLDFFQMDSFSAFFCFLYIPDIAEIFIKYIKQYRYNREVHEFLNFINEFKLCLDVEKIKSYDVYTQYNFSEFKKLDNFIQEIYKVIYKPNTSEFGLNIEGIFIKIRFNENNANYGACFKNILVFYKEKRRFPELLSLSYETSPSNFKMWTVEEIPLYIPFLPVICFDNIGFLANLVKRSNNIPQCIKNFETSLNNLKTYRPLGNYAKLENRINALKQMLLSFRPLPQYAFKRKQVALVPYIPKENVAKSKDLGQSDSRPLKRRKNESTSTISASSTSVVIQALSSLQIDMAKAPIQPLPQAHFPSPLLQAPPQPTTNYTTYEPLQPTSEISHTVFPLPQHSPSAHLQKGAFTIQNRRSISRTESQKLASFRIYKFEEGYFIENDYCSIKFEKSGNYLEIWLTTLPKKLIFNKKLLSNSLYEFKEIQKIAENYLQEKTNNITSLSTTQFFYNEYYLYMPTILFIIDPCLGFEFLNEIPHQKRHEICTKIVKSFSLIDTNHSYLQKLKKDIEDFGNKIHSPPNRSINLLT